MPRRRKLVRGPERPVDAPPPGQAPAPQAAPKDTQAPQPRRRLVKKGEHPAVAQFAGYPEAQERVRQALATDPRLQPSAFSWSPLRMGSALCAAEAERVCSGKSTKVPGLVMTNGNVAICRDCYGVAMEEGILEGKGFAVTLYEPRKETPATARTCLRCKRGFHGEQGR